MSPNNQHPSNLQSPSSSSTVSSQSAAAAAAAATQMYINHHHQQQQQQLHARRIFQEWTNLQFGTTAGPSPGARYFNNYSGE